MDRSLHHPLQPVCGQWLAKIKSAIDFKEKRFGADAKEGMRFFSGPYEFLYGAAARKADKHFRQADGDDADDGEIPAPRFQMTVNKTAEFVQIFGPTLYHQNPQRQVNPRQQPLPDPELMSLFAGNPMMGMQLQQAAMQGQAQRTIDRVRAILIQHYLNYTPDALDLKTESRWALDEALIKGMGVLWTEVYSPPAGGKVVGSFYDSVDNLVVDPDMPTIRASKWVARKRTLPVWEAERKFSLPPGTLKGTQESANRQAEVESHPDGSYLRASGQTNDLFVYWEVYSKTGLGGRLTGIDPWIGPELEVYGDFCYLCVADGVPFPLNVPGQLWDLPPQQGQQAIMQAIQWPTPFWADDDWPFTDFTFHTIPGDPWPMSHLAPGMGELKFLNWAYSYIAGKIRVSCRDFVAILEEAGDDIKEAILHGTDYELIRIKGSHGKSIDQIVQFLQHPSFNNDIWKVIEAIADQFERRVGLTELMYGDSARQMRSAQEATIKSNAIQARPDDMANKVEDAMSRLARHEALAIRWHLTGKDVAPIVGPAGSMMWDQFLSAANIQDVLFSLEYRIEAGSVRKPNRERDAQNAKDAATMLLPIYSQVAMQGVTGPFNALVTAWANSIDMDPAGLLLPTPPPPQPAPPPAPGPGGPPQQQPPQ